MCGQFSIFLGCRFRSRWQALSEEEMADCARGRSVRYLRVQLNAVLGSSYGAIPNFATEKEQKRNFFDFIDVTLVA